MPHISVCFSEIHHFDLPLDLETKSLIGAVHYSFRQTSTLHFLDANALRDCIQPTSSGTIQASPSSRLTWGAASVKLGLANWSFPTANCLQDSPLDSCVPSWTPGLMVSSVPLILRADCPRLPYTPIIAPTLEKKDTSDGPVYLSVTTLDDLSPLLGASSP